MMGKIGNLSQENVDVNGDGVVNIADIINVTYIITVK
jgi:hypothetical protein